MLMPIVCAETGKRLGRVKSVNVDRKLLCVTGLWVSGRFLKQSFYPRESILLLGKTAVLVSGESANEETGDVFSLKSAYNAAGAKIGAVINAYADEETLEIKFLEISRDIFSDIARGRRIHRLYTVNEETGDAVIDEEREE